MSFILTYPNEIWFHIISFLPFHDLVNFRRTCQDANAIGLSLLHSKTTLVSAFWLFCQHQKFEWLATRNVFQLTNIKKTKHQIVVFHHSERGDAFVVKFNKVEFYEFDEFHTTHCQLKFDSLRKILFITYSRQGFFLTKTIAFDLMTNKIQNTIIPHDYELNTDIIFMLHFNCHQPKNHKFFYDSKGGYRYYLIIEGSKTALQLEAKTTIRILKSIEVQPGVLDVEFVTGRNLTQGIVDFNKCTSSTTNYRIKTPNNAADCECYFIGNNILYYDEFVPFELQFKKNVIHFSFLDIESFDLLPNE